MEAIDLKSSDGTHNSLEINLDSLVTNNDDTDNVKVITDPAPPLGVDLLINKAKITEPVKIEEKIENETKEHDNNVLDLNDLLNDESLSSSKVDLANSSNDSNDNIFSLDNNNLDNTLSEVSLDAPKKNISLGSNENKSEPSVNNNTSNYTFTAEPIETERPKIKSAHEIKQEKADLLKLLDRMRAKGIKVDKNYTMESDYTEMKNEYERIKERRAVEQSVKFQRKMLVAFVTAIEFLNGKFDPLNLKLDGWSESVHEGVHDYDDIFEELHEKYKEKATMAPELRLILMLAGSGFMFHLTNTMFKTSLPGMGEVFKQNPDLMNHFTKATLNTMGNSEPGFANLMSDVIGSQSQAQPQNIPMGRPTMNGPPKLDDILSGMSSSNEKPIDIDMHSSFSDSDSEVARNINLSKKNGRGLNLNL